MWVYCLLLLIVMVTAVVFRKRKVVLSVLIFGILGTFSALRDGIGIDYVSYMRHIRNIARGLPNYMEVGFQFFARLIAGYWNDERSVIIFFSYVTCLFFVLGIYYQSKDIKMSLFLFLTWGYYFLTFNSIRTYVALSIVFFAMIFLQKKNYLAFAVSVIIAALFHKSALVCLLYPLANRKFKKSTYILLILFIPPILLMLKDVLRRFVFLFYGTYEGSVYDNGRPSWLNILKAFVIIMFGLIYFKKVIKEKENIFFFNLNIMAFYIYAGMYWLPEASRIGFFFNSSAILFLPNLCQSLDEENKRIANIVIYAGSLVLFYLLMREWYASTILLLPYKTWWNYHEFWRN